MIGYNLKMLLHIVFSSSNAVLFSSPINTLCLVMSSYQEDYPAVLIAVFVETCVSFC